MGGFGLGEAILIVTIAAAVAIVFVGFGVQKRIRGRGESTSFERRVLDELETIHLRLDMITARLDKAGIEPPPKEHLLPGDSEQGMSQQRLGNDAD